jgi:hypothetical protein
MKRYVFLKTDAIAAPVPLHPHKTLAEAIKKICLNHSHLKTGGRHGQEGFVSHQSLRLGTLMKLHTLIAINSRIVIIPKSSIELPG